MKKFTDEEFELIRICAVDTIEDIRANKELDDKTYNAMLDEVKLLENDSESEKGYKYLLEMFDPYWLYVIRAKMMDKYPNLFKAFHTKLKREIEVIEERIKEEIN